VLPNAAVLRLLDLAERAVIALERIAEGLAPAATPTKFCGAVGHACLAGCTANRGGRCARDAERHQRQPRGRA
jgi:hypothetical protein